MKEPKKIREPLFHVSKNDAMPITKSIAIRIGAIAIALLIIGILSVILIKENPFDIYEALFTGAFIDVWTLLKDTALLLLFGLAVIPAFKMKYWNMGANGQVLVGCLAAIACMKFLPPKYPDISNGLLITIMFAASITAAVIWSVIPAIFKAFFNTNETLFTLMMNYIALALVDYFILVWMTDAEGKVNKTSLGTVNDYGTKYELRGWLPNIADNQYIFPVIVALAVALIIFVYMKYSKHGFEVSLIGESVNTAKYVGINVKWVIIRTLVLCGIISGIIGAIYACSLDKTIDMQTGGLGFTAILVAWLASFDPLIMILTALFVEYITAGAEQISTVFQLNSNDYANIAVGIIFFCVIGCEFFIRYKINFNKTNKSSAVKEAE